MFVILTLAAYLVFAERRLLAWIQDRKGPNRVGPFGLLQPLADLIKLLTKEDFRPPAGDKWLFYLAPAMAAIPAIMIFAHYPVRRSASISSGHGRPAGRRPQRRPAPLSWRSLPLPSTAWRSAAGHPTPNMRCSAASAAWRS